MQLRSKIILILIGLLIYTPLMTQGAYCSAYCSYFFFGNVYSPMCTNQTSTSCTKCNEQLFQLNGGTCQVHGYYNQTLHTVNLNPPTAALTGWSSLNSNFRYNTRGVYQLLEIYYETVFMAPNIGGDDRVYRTFNNLPPHYSIRVRFFVLRNSGANMNVNYYIDSTKYNYNFGVIPSNLTLGDIITTNKIAHKDVNLTIALQVDFLAVNQYFGIKQLMIFISKCSSNCLVCDSSQTCKKCGTLANGTQTYLHNGYCYVDCPQTLYENGTLNTCDLCLNQCQNCNVNASHCSQCKFEGRYQTFLLNNSCYYNCPNGFVQEFDNNTCICPIEGYYITASHLCQACAPQCLSCTGSTRTQCINCSAGNYLVYGTNWCSRTCPADQYTNDQTRKCYKCAPICASCQNSATQCTSCFFTNSKRYLYNRQCVYDCPSGYAKNNLTRICDKCLPFYYSYNGQCMMECPQNYIPNNQSKSCIHLSETDYTLQISIQKIDILIDGQTMVFRVHFPSGLSQSSKSWLYSQSYYHVNLLGENINTLSTGVTMQSDKTYLFIYKVSQDINENSQFIINFKKKLSNPLGIKYASISQTFKVSQQPEFLQAYYKRSQKYYFNLIFIPLFITLATLFYMRIGSSYQLLMEKVRALQLIALAIFVAYPLQSQTYYLFLGLNYFNFEPIPNIYNMFVLNFANSQVHKAFLGFQLLYGDMDFIRMIGSILTFIAVWITLMFVCKYLLKVETQTSGWLLRLGLDLIQIKILYSYWNSLLFTIINSSQNNIFIFMVHLVSYIFIGFILYRYYKVYQTTKQLNYLFVWRVLATLLLTISVFNPMIVFIVMSLFSIGIGIVHYKKIQQTNKQTLKYKWGKIFIARDITISLMPLLSVLGISLLVFYKGQIKSIDMITVYAVFEYLLVLGIAFIIVFLRCFYKKREKAIIAHIKKQEKWQQTQLYRSVVNHSTSQNNIMSEQKTQNNQSFIKDQFAADFQNVKQDIIHQQREQDYSEVSQNQPVSTKFKRTNLSQVLPRRENTKFQPLRTISKGQPQQIDVDFQNITLSPSKVLSNSQSFPNKRSKTSLGINNNIILQDNQSPQRNIKNDNKSQDQQQ